jgi:protein-S-isoprenylcysteine O-methyltransferase Ste14
MSFFELKIPPVVIVLIAMISMFGIRQVTPVMDYDDGIALYLFLAFVLIGVVYAIAGVYAFRREQTTVNPNHPENTSTLVTSGVYGLTRNPMYLGFLFILAGWGIYLESMYALMILIFYFYYMNRFQIEPEEKILETQFKKEFLEYKNSVKRWL